MDQRIKNRRLRNELRRFGTDLLYEVSGENEVTTLNKFNQIVKIIYPNEYPFKQPNVYINNKEYLSILCNPTFSTDNIIKLANVNCLCCISILCGNNWNAGINILDILNEIDKFYTLKKRYVERIYATKIKDKYLYPDSNIIEYL